MLENQFLLTVTIVLVILAAICFLGMCLKMWMRHRAWTLGWNDGSSGAETPSFEPGSDFLFLSYSIGYHQGLAARAQAAAEYKERS